MSYEINLQFLFYFNLNLYYALGKNVRMVRMKQSIHFLSSFFVFDKWIKTVELIKKGKCLKASCQNKKKHS